MRRPTEPVKPKRGDRVDIVRAAAARLDRLTPGDKPDPLARAAARRRHP